jgi:virginiamycin B lyase
VLYRLAADVGSSIFARIEPKKLLMTKRELPKTAAAIIAMSGAAAMTAVVAPALAQNLPNGNGRDAVQMICTGCHDLSPITDAVGFSRQDWETVVKSMIDMGATITPEQAAVIANYLAANFPPKPQR